MAHPDEVVKPEHEEPSRLVAEAKLRHEIADSDYATPQEKKQAAVEQAHALSTRPDGSYAQLHETEEPTLAVAGSSEFKELKKEHDETIAALEGVQEAADKASASTAAKKAAPAK
jgi:hypothetical protein